MNSPLLLHSITLFKTPRPPNGRHRTRSQRPNTQPHLINIIYPQPRSHPRTLALIPASNALAAALAVRDTASAVYLPPTLYTLTYGPLSVVRVREEERKGEGD
ncbi:hypothetical protein FRC12_007494 [Ceratobasidium sp. 428]|nr:hypothetical protein FRC12_007494 [Ceratobasidium sp. 428]